MARKRRTQVTECDACWGCGHICNVCEFPINACECKALHTDETERDQMRECEDCGATGKLQPEIPEFLQPTREMARA